MRHRQVIGRENEDKWRLLEVTLGSRDASIDNELQGLLKFLNSFEPIQKDRYKDLTGVDLASPPLDIKQVEVIQSLMLKKFIDSVGVAIIQEALRRPNRHLTDLYLDILEKILKKNRYPEDIYVYSVYRNRGTPRTWLSVDDKYTSLKIEETINQHIEKLGRSLTRQMKVLRKPVMSKKVNGLLIHLLAKPIGSKIILAENGNVDVSRISYSLIVADLKDKKIGIVTGSKKEIFFAQKYLIHKAFKDGLGTARNDVKANGIKLLESLIQPKESDALTLQSVDFKHTALDNNPSLKIQAEGNKSIDVALTDAKDFWAKLSITALKEAGFTIPTDKYGGYKRVGIYTHTPDDWDRITLNTTHRSVTARVESLFLNQISGRLDDIDIKESRFVLREYDARYVVDKLLRHKVISTAPAIPKEVDEYVVDLTARNLIIRQSPSTKRKCWNRSCYATSWDQVKCPRCGQDDMRIIGEEIAIKPNEQQIIKGLSLSKDFPANLVAKYYPSKRRNNEKKSVIGIYNKEKDITTFVVIVSKKKDITFVADLAREGFGVVAIIDPKMELSSDEIESFGCKPISLTDIVLYLLEKEDLSDFLAAIDDQEKSHLTRIFDNGKRSVEELDKKEFYDARKFEVDIKNVMQILVPDVIRLGTEWSGQKVPDGYLKYGVAGKRETNRGRRLFGWDAKYSATKSYSLGSADTRKQNGYINWLTDKKEEPSKFGKLGIYAIIANFDGTGKMNTTLTSISKHKKLGRGRICLIEDKLLVLIGSWLLCNWKQVLDNNSAISDEFFKWLKRRPRKGFSYTVSRESDWPRLKVKLDQVLAKK